MSAFRGCVGSSEAKLDTNHLEHHPEGWACGWVGRQAEHIKRILKSSWQLNKTAPKAACHGVVFKRWPPLSVSGFVHVLVSQRFHLPPCLSHRCLCNYY